MLCYTPGRPIKGTSVLVCRPTENEKHMIPRSNKPSHFISGTQQFSHFLEINRLVR
jgi:hypothetical protein